MLIIEKLTNKAIIYQITNTNFTTSKDPLFNESYNTITKGIANCNSTTSKGPLFNELYTLIAKEAYNSNMLSRYTSAQFHSILINTGATKHSTARYSQFQAL